MSGHSHWAGIKRKKALVDAKRAQNFTKLTRAITIAAKEGGGNPEFNPLLRLAIEKAREFNVPKDKIEKAIRKGTGEEESENLEEKTYEALGPAGTMFIIRTISDNSNRTVGELRRIMEKNNGKMADGGIGWNFKRFGILAFSVEEERKEELINSAIENQAEDFLEEENGDIMIKCAVENLNKIKNALAGYRLTKSEIRYLPLNPLVLTEKDKAKYVKLLSEIYENPDVQDVYDNVTPD